MYGNIKLTRIKDNSTVDIIFLDNFLNREILNNNNNKRVAINIWNTCVQIKLNNKQVAIDNLDMMVNIKNLLDLLDFDKKVLILCHNKLVTGTFDPLTLNNHWFGLYDIFPRLFKKYNLEGNPLFETVDVKPGATYQEDAFSDDFINSHQCEYDLVMVPDCGGNWVDFQFLESEDSEPLIKLCLKITQMVKPNGIILFSKFINRDYLISSLNTVLVERGFITNIINEAIDNPGNNYTIPIHCIIGKKEDTLL
jgi:hypothetical protein